MATKTDAGYTLTEQELASLEKRIQTVYSAAAKDLQKTADQYFSKFTRQDQEQAQRVADGSLTESEYRQWRLNTFGRGERFSQLAQQMAERATNANVVATSYINDAMPSVYALNRNYTAYSLDYALKNGRTVFNTGDQYSGMIDWNLMDESTVRRLIVEQPELMPNYPQQLAVNRGIDLAYGQKKIGQTVTSGIIRGASVGEIATALTQTITGMSRTSALRAARTACTSAQNAGRMDMMTHAVEDLGIQAKKIWISARDGRTRESHVQLDGVQVEYNKKFPNKLMYPGDRSGRPEEVYNCRCSIGYVLPDTEDDFNGNGKYATGNTVESYKEWLAQQGTSRSSGGSGGYTNTGTSGNNFTSSVVNGNVLNEGEFYGEPIQVSVGAKSRNYPDVENPFTGEQLQFVTGSRPIYPSDHTMAGLGCKSGRVIDDIDRLVYVYNADENGWQKEKARYEVFDEYGDIRQVELHWYQHSDIGRVEYKVKVKRGSIYIDEW